MGYKERKFQDIFLLKGCNLFEECIILQYCVPAQWIFASTEN